MCTFGTNLKLTQCCYGNNWNKWVFDLFYFLFLVNKFIYRSMENLNSRSAFPDHTSTGGASLQTLPLSGFTFTSNSSSSPSGHLTVPGSAAAFTSQTVPRNPRVVPMITRSQSSSNLPENVMENPYDEVGGGFGSHVIHRMPKKSCSQWDMLGTSRKNNHLQVGRGLQFKQIVVTLWSTRGCRRCCIC